MYEKIELIISEYKLNRITKEKCLIELKNHIKQIIKLNYTHCCTELKAIEDLKDFAYNNCQLHNTDQLDEIIERL